MSGIFKAVKKTIKKVGKVIKKIGPTLLIAAAVYFGGAYLMSSGAASAGAAGSVGTSFTKAGGVWKAFLSGMGNGTASQSAAAYAEASYQASLGANALPLSGQVAAGTSAVNALSNMGSTSEAVAAGLDLARSAAVQSGGDVNLMQDIVQNAMASSQKLVADAKTAGMSPAAGYNEMIGMGQVASHPGQGGHIGGLEDPDLTLPEHMARQQGLLQAGQTGDPRAAYAGEDVSYATTASTAANLLLDKQYPQVSQSTPGGGTAPRNMTGSDRMYEQTNQLYKIMLQGQADSRAYNQQLLESRNKVATQQMWMQGTGMLLSAIGASEDTLEEKKDKRKMAWKPSGKEEYASGAGKIYPGGLLS